MSTTPTSTSALATERQNLLPDGGAAPPVSLTYAELMARHNARLDHYFESEGFTGGKAEQIKRNHRTALNDWMSRRGVSPLDVVGREFGEDFAAELERHQSYLRAKPHNRKGKVVKGLADKTVENRISILGQWRDSWLASVNFVGGAASWKTISEALKDLAGSRSMTAYAFSKAVGVDDCTFLHWFLGESNPSNREKTVKAFRSIERYCGLKEGELISLIRTVSRPRRGVGTGGPRSQHSLRQERATSERYKMNVFPPRLQAEFDGWFDLMTPMLEPEGGLRRNGHWFIDPETRECPTAVRNKSLLAGFFGYLCLPVNGRRFPIPKWKREAQAGVEEGEDAEVGYTVVCGEGFNQNSLTLALVSDVSLVKRFLEFGRVRAGGHFNGDTVHFLNMCCTLLREGTGYIRQHPEYGQRLPQPVSAEEWDGRCASAHRRFRDVLLDLNKNHLVRQSRDVSEPIDFILNDAHPIHYLYELADLMEGDLPGPPAKYKRAMSYRDMFLVRFLTANPLRIKHFSKMTWKADNTGNLYQERDGSWWLRFPKETFKNRKVLRKDIFAKEYRAALPPSLWPYVETYLFEHRPLLLGADRCDYVFRPGPRGGTLRHKTGDTNPMRKESLSDILHWHAKHYLRCMGFGAHAYRHIIATDFLKNNPDGLMIAASLLHDRPETILRYYGHVQHGDYFRHWLDYHEAQLAESRSQRAGRVAA
ncbi:MAG TPA: hypothetical protein VN282_05760 [Pyrinomonadaceae bacterium]|nr:hypothetical protein [Pyrinomonadaceae bacterium]